MALNLAEQKVLIDEIMNATKTAYGDVEALSRDASEMSRQEAEKQAKLLVDAMILGLQGIQTNYGKKFLTLDFKEV